MKIDFANATRRWAIPFAFALVIATSPSAVSGPTRGTDGQTPAAPNQDSQNEKSDRQNQDRHSQTDVSRSNMPSAMSDQQVEGFIRHALASGREEVEIGLIAKDRAKSEEVSDYAEMLVKDHRKANQKLIDLAKKENINLPATLTRGVDENAYQRVGNPSATAEHPEHLPGQSTTSSTTGRSTPGTDPATTRTDRASTRTDRDMSGDDRVTRGNVRVGNDAQTPGNTANAPRRTDRDRQAGIDARGDSSDRSDSYRNNEARTGVLNQEARELANLTGSEFDQRFLELQIKHHQDAIQRYETMANSTEKSDVRHFAQETVPVLREHLQKAQSLQGEIGKSDKSQSQ